MKYTIGMIRTMKIGFLAFVLPCVFLPAVTEAQNVLLPSGSTVTTKSAAPAPTSTTATTTTTDSAAPAAVLPTTPSYGGQSTPVSTSTAYIPVAQQNSMIQNEQQNIASLQQILTQMNQADQNMAATASAPGQTQAQLGLIAQTRQTNAQNAATLTAQIQKSQKRLAILQSGPLTVENFVALSQAN